MSITLSGYRFPRGLRVLLAVAGAVIGLCVLASASQAACAYPDAEQVFAPWNDYNYYQLAPDGGLEEGGTGWTLEGGAELVAGNEDEYLNGSEDEVALDLPFGAVATSPRVCVDPTTPVFRLMALNTGVKDAKLKVSVYYESANRKPEKKDSDVKGLPEWSPTEAVKLETHGGEERVARISFTSKDHNGDWQIDDLYIDPFARR